MAEPATPEAAAPDFTHLRVTAKKPGFRRSGRAWYDRPDTIPASEFTADQIAALEAEPMLVVQRLTLPDQPGAASGKATEKDAEKPAGKPAAGK